MYLQIISGLGSCPAAAAEALSSSLEVSVFLLYRESTHSPVLTLWGLCLLPAAVTHCNHREQRPLGYIIIMELFVNFTKGLKLPFLNHNCELEN